MKSLIVSTSVVAFAELGDKTQLLAFVLAARYRKRTPVVLGVLVATLVNHTLAAALGRWITMVISPETMRWVLGFSFLAMAIWTMIPDTIDEDSIVYAPRLGIFGMTLLAFFLAEMADKTQIATVALAARYESTMLVVAGTTLGMLIADVPAIFLGKKFANKVPTRLLHGISAVIFFVIGMATLFRWDRVL